MGYLLFIFYIFFFSFIIPRINFFKKSGLSSAVLIVLFLVKVIAGVFNSYINAYYYPVSDAVAFHEQGVEEYNLLLNNTLEYFTNIFKTNYTNYSGFLETSGSFWNDLRTNIIAKILSIFNLFSGRNFFIDNLFFDFLIFFGAIYFYRLFLKIFPSSRARIIICIFLLPSVLYFTSGIHRDGFIFLALSVIVYHLHSMIEKNAFPWKKTVFVILSLCLILLLRNFVFITLLPALIAWIVSSRFPRYAFIIFAGFYTICILIFFCSGWLGPDFDLPQHVSDKQIQFIEIAKGGSSAISINPLYPNFRSFLNNAPQAINHSLMRPYLTERLNFLYAPLALEIFAYEVLFFLFIFFRADKKSNPFIYFCFYFSLSMFLIIGYTIPILGAIVRYRSIYFPFLLIPIICFIDWQKLKASLHINKK
jgi:hypothetical protein